MLLMKDTTASGIEEALDYGPYSYGPYRYGLRSGIEGALGYCWSGTTSWLTGVPTHSILVMAY